MARARRDQNHVTTLIGVSFSDLETPVELALDPVNNRLLVSALVTSQPVYTPVFDGDSTADTLYTGWADPGTAHAAAGWRIQKLDTSVGANSGVATWADGNANFDNVWANRLSLTYS
jgi:hypothetical protein